MLNGGELVKDGPTDEIVELYQEAAWTRVRRRPRNARDTVGELMFVKLTAPDGREIAAAGRPDAVSMSAPGDSARGGPRVKAMDSS